MPESPRHATLPLPLFHLTFPGQATIELWQPVDSLRSGSEDIAQSNKCASMAAKCVDGACYQRRSGLEAEISLFMSHWRPSRIWWKLLHPPLRFNSNLPFQPSFITNGALSGPWGPLSSFASMVLYPHMGNWPHSPVPFKAYPFCNDFSGPNWGWGWEGGKECISLQFLQACLVALWYCSFSYQKMESISPLLGQMACFCQWNISKHDVEWGLKKYLCTKAFSLAYRNSFPPQKWGHTMHLQHKRSYTERSQPPQVSEASLGRLPLRSQPSRTAWPTAELWKIINRCFLSHQILEWLVIQQNKLPYNPVTFS